MPQLPASAVVWPTDDKRFTIASRRSHPFRDLGCYLCPITTLEPKMSTTLSRRSLLRGGIGLSVLLTGKAIAGDRVATAAQTAGPFYPLTLPAESDTDLTQLGVGKPATGAVICVEGRVFDTTGAIKVGATVEIWQANAAGRYTHPGDPSTHPLDPGFQGWGKAITGADGRYRFKTIVPGAYLAAPGWRRPPHIRFKVTPRAGQPLITQMYFATEKSLNEKDDTLQRLTKKQRAALTVKFKADAKGLNTGTLDLVLKA